MINKLWYFPKWWSWGHKKGDRERRRTSPERSSKNQKWSISKGTVGLGFWSVNSSLLQKYDICWYRLEPYLVNLWELDYLFVPLPFLCFISLSVGPFILCKTKIIAAIEATYAVANREPEKNIFPYKPEFFFFWGFLFATA